MRIRTCLFDAERDKRVYLANWDGGNPELQRNEPTCSAGIQNHDIKYEGRGESSISDCTSTRHRHRYALEVFTSAIEAFREGEVFWPHDRGYIL